MAGEKTFTYVIDAETDDFKTDIDAAATSLGGLQEEAEAAKAPLADLSKAKKQLATATKTLTSQQKKQQVELKKSTKLTKDQARASEESAKAWKEFGAAAATAALAAGVALVALTANVADARNEILDMAARTGVAAETLEGLKFAAEGSGRQFSDLNEVLNPFLARLAQVRAGSKEAEDRFKNLGISLRDASGELVDNDEALKRVVKTIQSAEDPSKKTAIALQAIGEGGGKLIQVLGDVPLDTFIAQTSQFSIVGEDAASSAQSWQRSLADLRLVMTSAAASVSDFLNIGPNLDKFVVGFVFAQGAVSAVAEQIATDIEIVSSILSGDLVPGTEAWEEAGKAVAVTFDDVAAAGEAAAFEFLKNNKAIREGANAAGETSAAIGELADSHNNAAEAAKAQKQAEQDLVAVFNLARNAVDALADSRATATEMAVNQSQVDIRAVEAARDKAIESNEDRVQAEAAAAVAIQAIRQKLREDVEEIQLAEQEEVTFPILDAEVEAHLEAQQKMTEASKKAAEQQKAGAEALRDSMIGAAQEASTAIIAGFSEQNRQFLEQQDQQLDRNIAILEMKKSLTDEELQALNGLREKKDQLAKFDFLREKAAALASAAVNVAASIVQAAASLPPPANIPFIAGAAALGAVQLAIIGGTKMKAHDGEALISSFGAPAIQSGEVDRRVLEGESILNQRASNQLGREGVNALNAGAGGTGGGRTVIMLDGAELARSTVKHMRGDGPLAIAAAGRSPGIGTTFGGR